MAWGVGQSDQGRRDKLLRTRHTTARSMLGEYSTLAAQNIRARRLTYPNIHAPEVLRVASLADQPLDLLFNRHLLRTQRFGVRRDLEAQELVRDRLERLERSHLRLVRPKRAVPLFRTERKGVSAPCCHDRTRLVVELTLRLL